MGNGGGGRLITAILIGRRNSKGFPGKNTCKVLGKPMAYYPMRAATGCPEVDRIYISTDDERLMALADKNGLGLIRRPARLCTDRALGEDVFVHAYNTVKGQDAGCRIELLVLLMCNAVTISSRTISDGIRILRRRPDYDSAVTVSRYNMWSPLRARRIGDDGLLHPFVPFGALGDTGRLNCDRDSQGDAWFADMGASIIRPRCLENIEKGLLPQRWMGRKIYPLKQSGGLDVDYRWQVPAVEYWLKTNMRHR